MKKRFTLTMAALLLFALGCSRARSQSNASNSNSSNEVTIDNFTFTPAVMTINSGTTVTWANKDDVPHTIASDDKIFKSKALDTDEKFTYTFTKPGEYPYFCSLHPKMTAKIVVR